MPGYKKPHQFDPGVTPAEALTELWRWYYANFKTGPWAEKSSQAQAGLMLHYASQVTALMAAWLHRSIHEDDLVRGLLSLRLSLEAYARGEAFEDFMIDRLHDDVSEE